MTQAQAREFTEFAAEWASIYCEYHNFCKPTDIPLDIAVAVAEMLLDNEEREHWELDEQTKEEYEATKLFVYKYRDEAMTQLTEEFADEIPFDGEEEESNENQA